MNSLHVSLYNMYSKMKTTKELWKFFDRKYKTKNARGEKFFIGNFLNYKMVDFKTIINQM